MILGGDGRVLKGRQGGAATFHRLPSRKCAWGGEVVAGGDLGEPLVEPFQVASEAAAWVTGQAYPVNGGFPITP